MPSSRGVLASVLGLLAGTLALALAIALVLAFWRRAAPPLPPTPPGADPAFDRRLADLDRRYRFLFVDGDRIVAAGLGDARETVLLALPGTADKPARIARPVALSPDGRRLLVRWHGSAFEDEANRHLLVLDVDSAAGAEVTIPFDGYGLDTDGPPRSLFHWLASDRFVISLTSYPGPGLGERKRLFAYRLDDLATPRPVAELQDPNLVIAPDTRGVFWYSGHDPPSALHVQALDAASGRNEERVRVATPAERARVAALESAPPPAPGGPAPLQLLEHEAGPEPLWGEWEPPAWEILLGERAVARFRGWGGGLGAPVWHPELELYTWEDSTREPTGEVRTFLVDAQGRHRLWRRGALAAILPRG